MHTRNARSSALRATAAAVFYLSRPVTCLMAAVSTGIGALAVTGPGGLEAPTGGAALCAALITAGGNTLNDSRDEEIDRVNHPGRPIPSGCIDRRTASAVAACELALGLGLGWIVNPWCGLIATFAVGTLLAYEWRLKDAGLPGNVAIGVLAGLLFVTGGAAAGDASHPATLALLSFLAILGREITKDVADVTGDTTRRTWPMRVGVPAARLGAAVSFALAILLGPLPYALGTLSVWYLPVATLAASGFAATIVVLYRRPHDAPGYAKVSMAVTLGAFLAGAG